MPVSTPMLEVLFDSKGTVSQLYPLHFSEVLFYVYLKPSKICKIVLRIITMASHYEGGKDDRL